MSVWIAALTVGIVAGVTDSTGTPNTYTRQYEQDFSSPESLRDFAFPDPAAWRLTTVADRTVLEQHQQVKLTPPYRSPFNFCLIAGQKYGDFIMDVECQQTSREYGHRDMVFVFGYQDPARFYYAHIATKADDHAHQIFIVHEAPRTKITTRGHSGIDWGGPNDWKKVRVERKLDTGSIRIYFEDLTKPILEATDTRLGAGWLGFGTFDDTCRIRRVTIDAPNAEPAKSPPLAPVK
jgi:hypothetical protein